MEQQKNQQPGELFVLFFLFIQHSSQNTTRESETQYFVQKNKKKNDNGKKTWKSFSIEFFLYFIFDDEKWKNDQSDLMSIDGEFGDWDKLNEEHGI